MHRDLCGAAGGAVSGNAHPPRSAREHATRRCRRILSGCCRSRKSHPRGFAPEGESGQHHMRCLPSSICLRCSSRICSNRGGSWKSRTSFFVTSSTSPSGVHRAVCGCVGATGRCWYGCHGFGQACLGRPGSFSLTRYCGGIEQDFAPIGAGNPALGQGGLRLAVSCANSSIG